MDITTLTSAVEQVGFPIILCFAFAFCIYKMFNYFNVKIDNLILEHKEDIKTINADHKEQMQTIIDSIATKIDKVLDTLKGDE